jgi:3-oxoadipate enol-lactonase
MTGDGDGDGDGADRARGIVLPGRGATFVHDLDGPPGAPTVLLLHGWLATAAVNWTPSLQPLAEHFRVLAMDLRGHGWGITPRGRFLLEDCADDVSALLDVLGLSRVVVAGYSMGGAVAQLTWRRHPDKVEGLVLCSTATHFPPDPSRARLTSVVAALLSPTGLLPEQLRRRMNAGQARLFAQATRWRGGDSRMTQSLDLLALTQAGEELHRFDSRRWVSDIDVPTTVVATTADDVVPYSRQAAMEAAVPEATLRQIAGDHRVCVSRPDLFVPALIDACTEVSRRARAAPA